MSIEVTNQRQFSIQLGKISEELGLTVSQVQRKIALDIFGDIVAGTPVLTGRAMNNWNISVNTPNRSINEGGGPAAVIQGAKSSEALTELSALQPFQTVWISNSLDYIGYLEEGSSDKAPNGWVLQSVLNNIKSMGGVV